MATSPLVGALVLSLALGGPQESRPDAASGTIALGDASAAPGSAVVSPLSLSAPEPIHIRALEVRLTYDSSLLSFDKAEPSGLALGISAEVTAAVEESADEGSSVLRLRIAAPSERELPPGPLAYIRFRIAQKALPETAIAIRIEAVGQTADAPGQAVTLDAAPGRIIVSAPPVPACFFYMH
jgi:hypothetical protein